MKQGGNEEGSCLASVWVQGQEVSVTRSNQFNLLEEPIPSHPIFRNKVEHKALEFQWAVPSLNTSEVPIEVAILLACIMDHLVLCYGHWMGPVRANSVIKLATKIVRTPSEASKVYKEHDLTIIFGIYSHNNCTTPYGRTSKFSFSRICSISHEAINA
ncbi:hypothetical protein HAX54_000280 [Datura stramonium]|uniref:Uncharacterized protein n=1 Tax=Datura stramonium TaxID=4076 RepID=A0ABS8WTM5_DATST|nr:hypothetical protein [Datura stramonium]